MKTMTCHQLGGACDEEFHANSFEDMADLSKQHCMRKLLEKDEDHVKAFKEMQTLMENPEVMNQWFMSKLKEFSELQDS